MDACARALKAAAAMLKDGKLERLRAERYAGWRGKRAQEMLAGRYGLEEIETHVREAAINPEPVSGRQERLENLVNSYL